MKKNNVFILLIIFSSLIFAQNEKIVLTGNLHSDFKLINKEYSSKISLTNLSSEKSPILAGLFSAVLPGAGEIYTERYIKSVLFIALEVAGWYYNIQYNKKGDDQTTFFQSYADNNWNVVRYAEWLNTYAQQLGATNPVFININPNTALAPWQRVNWDELNAAEGQIKEFSHKIYPHGEQQYYEMIGKYQQFGPGWPDYNSGKDYYDNPPALMKYYSNERGKANDFYNVADKVVILIILNHVVSAVDAFISANAYNSEIKTSVTMQRIDNGITTEYFPQLNFRIAL